MENYSKDILILIQYLLPGFVTAWIFYAFTSYIKPSQFERVIQALIYTIIVQAIVYVIQKILYWIGEWEKIQKCVGEWNSSVNLIYSLIIAILLGFLFTYFANNDKFHNLIRRVNITRETSYPSEWFRAFLKNITFIVLHLKDERRIMGWPVEWPSNPKHGHFMLTNASWLDGNKAIKIKGSEYILINNDDVKWVEFLEKTWEKKHGK
ncbi:MAG: hypothetical protein JW807_12680 [Spirochaetes bacterium]|nr:hypothetical protein [Spirochaetota bacterium]